MGMRCRSYRKAVVGMETADPGDQRYRALREHEARCAACRAWAVEMAALRALLGRQSGAGAPAGFREAAMARVRASAPRVAPSPVRPLPRWAWAGAGVAIALTVGLLLPRHAPVSADNAPLAPGASALAAVWQEAEGGAESEPLQQLLLTHSNYARQEGFHGELGLELMSCGPAAEGVRGAGG